MKRQRVFRVVDIVVVGAQKRVTYNGSPRDIRRSNSRDRGSSKQEQIFISAITDGNYGLLQPECKVAKDPELEVHLDQPCSRVNFNI